MKTPPQPKAPRARVKARKMYMVSGHPFAKLYINGGWTIDTTGKQLSVLPRSKEAQEAMIEAGAAALRKFVAPQFAAETSWKDCVTKEEYRAKSRAVLASANLVEKE